MGLPIPFLIVLQIFMNELPRAGAWFKYLGPVDGLSGAALQRYYPYHGDALRLRFYVKSGDQWQRAGDAGGAHWSGYETLGGDRYRYAQARVHYAVFEDEGEEEESTRRTRVWVDGGLIDNIPTCIPARCLPDYSPVLSLVRWLGEKARVRLRYVSPLEKFTQADLADTDPFVNGNQGEFGAVIVEPTGFKRLQRGVDVAGVEGKTPVVASAVGRVVLASPRARRKAVALDLRTGDIIRDFPRGRPDKGSALKEYGNCVYVMYPDGYSMRYAHLGEIEVEAGQGVLPGTPVGTVGASPLPSGETMAWAHIEVRRGDPFSDKDSVPLNPMEFIASKAENSADTD